MLFGISLVIISRSKVESVAGSLIDVAMFVWFLINLCFWKCDHAGKHRKLSYFGVCLGCKITKCVLASKTSKRVTDWEKERQREGMFGKLFSHKHSEEEKRATLFIDLHFIQQGRWGAYKLSGFSCTLSQHLPQYDHFLRCICAFFVIFENVLSLSSLFSREWRVFWEYIDNFKGVENSYSHNLSRSLIEVKKGVLEKFKC